MDKNFTGCIYIKSSIIVIRNSYNNKPDVDFVHISAICCVNSPI